MNHARYTFRRAICVTFVLLLAACGGDDGDEAPAPGSNANRPPVISGTPPASVLPGALHTFTPTASDPGGDPLTFSVENAPPWTTFDPATGRLQGTPAAGDEGQYNAIRIGVSDGPFTIHLAAFTITVRDETAPKV